ncbi:MAG: bile acid:sodium symporter family protein [Flammeovirgaceae bacterium]|nr:bile acid:sodium symporter family protein [Flammeovirgaceae bacterium]
MEASILTEIFLPIALGVIMLGMGLSLTMDDFKRIALFPKATIIGLTCQLIVLPAVAFGMLKLINLPPELAVGVMLLAFCPGGATSNLLSNLARADIALSITLTAISSMVTVFTIPYFVNLSMEHFIGEGKFVELPFLQAMLQILVVTIIPVSIGMILKSKYPNTAQRFVKPVKIASAIFIVILIFGVIIKERNNIAGYFAQVGTITFMINILILAIGFGIARMFNLNHAQSSAISIESGIQNGTLAIAIATSTLLLNNTEMAIPAAVYSLIMFGTGGLAVFIMGRKTEEKKV